MHDANSVSQALMAARGLVSMLEEVEHSIERDSPFGDVNGSCKWREGLLLECRRQSRILDAHLRPVRAIYRTTEKDEGLDAEA